MASGDDRRQIPELLGQILTYFEAELSQDYGSLLRLKVWFPLMHLFSDLGHCFIHLNVIDRNSALPTQCFSAENEVSENPEFG